MCLNLCAAKLFENYNLKLDGAEKCPQLYMCKSAIFVSEYWYCACFSIFGNMYLLFKSFH